MRQRAIWETDKVVPNEAVRSEVPPKQKIWPKGAVGTGKNCRGPDEKEKKRRKPGGREKNTVWSVTELEKSVWAL